MAQVLERRDVGHGTAASDRLRVVLVSESAEDARAFRALAGAERALVVNVPDLAGARAAIEKLRPQLVVCDTEIEGEGSWRDLLTDDAGFALAVAARHVDRSLREEARALGGFDAIEKPFAAEDVERVLEINTGGGHQRREDAARKAVLHAARWSRHG